MNETGIKSKESQKALALSLFTPTTMNETLNATLNLRIKADEKSALFDLRAQMGGISEAKIVREFIIRGLNAFKQDGKLPWPVSNLATAPVVIAVEEKALPVKAKATKPKAKATKAKAKAKASK